MDLDRKMKICSFLNADSRMRGRFLIEDMEKIRYLPTDGSFSVEISEEVAEDFLAATVALRGASLRFDTLVTRHLSEPVLAEGRSLLAMVP